MSESNNAPHHATHTGTHDIVVSVVIDGGSGGVAVCMCVCVCVCGEAKYTFVNFTLMKIRRRIAVY